MFVSLFVLLYCCIWCVVLYYYQITQGGDGVQVSVIMLVMLVTGVRPNEQPGDLEVGEGAHVTVRPPRRAASAAGCPTTEAQKSDELAEA
jgi:hypothetical protein